MAAMDYDSGRRVAFGRPGEPEAELAEALALGLALTGDQHRLPAGGGVQPGQSALRCTLAVPVQP